MASILGSITLHRQDLGQRRSLRPELEVISSFSRLSNPTFKYKKLRNSKGAKLGPARPFPKAFMLPRHPG